MTRYAPVQLAYDVIEPKDSRGVKAPIIFLHGASALKDCWIDIPRIVADETKRKVYVLDARNHGDSEWTDTFNFDCNTDDLIHFMDHHQIPRAIIVGHSMGGITAIQASLRAPERVEMLAVEDINVRTVEQAVLDILVMYTSLAEDAIQQVPANVDEATAKKIVIEIISQKMPPEEHNLRKRETEDDYPIYLKRGSDGRYAFKSNMSVLRKAFENGKDLMSEPKGTFEGPTCFIYGNLSPFNVGADADNTKKFFPKAEFVGIENATHAVHNDCPQEFTDALLKFLCKYS